MRNVFIDAGCNAGDTLNSFLSSRLFPGVDPKQYEIYLFDVKDFSVDINSICEKHKVSSTFINKAVWINDEMVNCDFTKDKSVSSSIVIQDNKAVHYYYDQSAQVQAIDFSKWLMSNFKNEDNVLLKMDIEGAEFEVLQKMIRDRSFFIIKNLLIEFHCYFKFFHTKPTRKWYCDLRDLITSYMNYYGIKVTEYK